MKELENKLLDSLNNDEPSPVKIASPGTAKQTDPDILDKLLSEARISPSEPLQAPPVCLSIIENESTIDVCTLGNFSLAIGKAKSRKSFLTTLLFSVVTGHQTDKFSGGLPIGKKVGIYFDTEQSRYHVQKLLHRICKLLQKPVPENIIVYSLRKYSPKERLELIEHAINTTSNLGFVVIDGIKDLVTSINDEEQASMITSKLLKWTEENNIHIMAVLHQNKNDLNARGHLGTELTNKAETVISITKDAKDKNLSIVEPEYCRDKDFDPFAFTISVEGLPEIVAMEERKPKKENTKTPPEEKKNIIQQLGDENIYKLLCECFIKDSKIKRNDLKMRVKVLAASILKKEFGNNKADEILTYSESKNWVIQEKELAPYTLGTFT